MKHSISHLLPGLLLWASLTGVSAADSTPPTVLATSRPLHSMAAAVTHGISEAQLLIKGSASPHMFQLKPSHLKALGNADVVLWAGIGVERFIPKLLEEVASDAISLELAALPSAVLYKARGHHNDAAHGDQHDESDIDYHVWLEPQNALVAVQELALQLSQLDPDNAETYQANADAFSTELISVRGEIEQLLSASKGKTYLIYHDSLQYFEKAFGLGEAIVVTHQPQVQAGVKRLKHLRQQAKDDSPGCIFAEVQFRALSLQVLADDLDLQTMKIDPLASEFDSGPSLYADWLRHTATQIADCLQ